MTMDHERRFEVVTEGSDFAVLLCDALLAPVADALVGEDFRTSTATVGAQFERTVNFADYTALCISYDAHKSINEESDEQLLFSISVELFRPRIRGEWWPDEVDHDAEGVKRVMDQMMMDDDFTSENGEYEEMVEDEDDSYFTEVEEGELDYVKEVWEFHVDVPGYKTSKDVRFIYYDEYDDILGNQMMSNLAIGDKLLSEAPGEDIDLQTQDSILTQSFSEWDLRVIEAICKQDFVVIKKLLLKDGCEFGNSFEGSI